MALKKLSMFGKSKGINNAENLTEPVAQILNRIIYAYTTSGEMALATFALNQEIKHLITALDNEKEIHMKNNESLDRVKEILAEVIKRDDISQEERRDIYRIFAQLSNIHRDSQLQKSRHFTSRLIVAMGVAGSVAIALGSVLMHEKYKTEREREKWNNYFEGR